MDTKNIAKGLDILWQILYKEYTFKTKWGIKGRLYSNGKISFTITGDDNHNIIVKFGKDQIKADVSFLRIEADVDYMKFDKDGKLITVQVVGGFFVGEKEIVLDIEELMNGQKG